MKTTVTIPDSLLGEVRGLAAREGVTLQALVERGLRRVVAEGNHGAAFKLRRASFKGNGLRPELRGAPWGRLRALSYGRHGGFLGESH
jgi:hypothetical protein